MSKRGKEFTENSELAAVRLPRCLRREAREHAKGHDVTFSQLMRRALRRELGWPTEEINEVEDAPK